MPGEAAHGSAERPDTLLAPARSRLAVSTVPVTPHLPLLPPVLSGRFGPAEIPAASPAEPADARVDEPADIIDSAAIGELPLIPEAQQPEDADDSVLEWVDDEAPDPWDQDAAVTLESVELVLDAGAEEVDLVLEEGDETADIVELILDEDAAEAGGRPAPPPLSPWDLGAANADSDASDHAARARAEWESLDQALTGSLSIDALAGERKSAHGVELTDEVVASLESQFGDSYSPFGNLSRAGSTPGEDDTDRSAAFADLAERLEAFAAQIRAEGPEALARAQREGDRVDALLAGIAAGFIAGRAR